MEDAIKLINQIFEEVKRHYPDFERRQYDTSGTIYFGQNSHNYPGKNGNGFKFYKEYLRYKVGIKSNLKTGKLDDYVFFLPEQFEKARICILSLYEIPITNGAVIQTAISEFESALAANNLQLTPNPNPKGTTIRYLSKYDNSYAPVIISSTDDGAVIRIKKFVPLDSEKNKQENGCSEHSLLKSRNTKFINPIEDIHVLFQTIELFNYIVGTPVLDLVKDIATSYDLKLLDFYGQDFECKLVFSKGLLLSILKSKGKTIFRATDRIGGEIRNFDFSEDGLFEAFAFLLQYNLPEEKNNKRPKAKTDEQIDKIEIIEKVYSLEVGEAFAFRAKSNGIVTWYSENNQIVKVDSNGRAIAINAGKTRVFAKNGKAIDCCEITVNDALKLPPLSKKAQSFVYEISNLKIETTEEEYGLLFEQFDELSEEECEDSRVSEAYELLKGLALTDAKVPQTVRFVYASKTFLKALDELEDDCLSSVEDIKKAFNTCRGNELSEYLISKRLVYIDSYLKIRVKNGLKHRIIFCFGDRLGKNSKDIYVFDYNRTHNFSNIKNLHPEEQQYSLWTIEKPKITVPPLTKQQESISLSLDKPLICTGCAGSGKTLISVYMYLNLLERDYGGNASTSPEQLVYVTYNENAKDNASNQIKEVVEKANTKTVFEFFYDIAKPDLSNKKYADENNFAKWWKTEITDHLLKVKMNSLSKSNVIKYVYTFYRGLFKGSMYRWEMNHEDRYLTKEQMVDLLSKEPIDVEKINLIYSLCELYQHYLDSNHLYDDNDLARCAAKRMIKGISKKYNHIILDEVQDLTEVQLDAIVKCSFDKKKLYFFGDQNQSINPTLFNLDFIEMCLLRNNSYIETNDIYKLTNSYRFGPHLAKYINKLVSLKQRWIGTLSAEETEGSNKDLEKNRWAGKTCDASVIKEMIVRASNSANAIIIVPDESIKQELETKYGPEIAKRVTTIYDSKGLEWDYVVLYKMLKFNEDKYKEMVDGKGKYSTLHRMVFNQYYVGCTRALSCFTVLENDLDEEIQEPIIGDLQTITEANISLYIEEENDSTSWYKEAVRLFEAGIYDLALAAFEKADVTMEEEPKMEIASLLINEETKSDTNVAQLCKEKRFFKEASKVYQNAGKYRLAQLMRLYEGLNISDEDAWDIILNEKLTEEDMEVINKNGFLTSKSTKIENKLEKLLIELKGK